MKSSERVDGRQIIFYDLTAQQPQQLAVAPDVGIIRGEAWSHDNTKVLLEDAYFNHLLYLYDLNSKSLQFIAPHFDPVLESYEVVWSPNDQYVAFVGGDGPITQTEYADVVALYILDIKTLKYLAVSLPNETVDYYFGSFYWIDNNSVAFTRCAKSNKDRCGIKQTTIDGQILAELDGKYWLTGYEGNNQLEVLNLSHQEDEKGSVDLSILDLNSKSFTFVEQFPVDQITPYPIFSLLNDRQWLIYMNETGQTVFKNLNTSTTSIISQTSDWIAQTWSIDNNQLLFPTKSGFYFYDIKSGSSHLAFNYPNMDNVSSYILLCGETQIG